MKFLKPSQSPDIEYALSTSSSSLTLAEPAPVDTRLTPRSRSFRWSTDSATSS